MGVARLSQFIEACLIQNMSGKLVIGAEASKDPGDEAITGISISIDRFDEGVVGDGKKQYRFKDGRAWIHPPDKLINDKVTYRCTHLGAMQVSEPKGSAIVRDSVDRLKLVAEVKRSDGMKLPEVDISICIRTVTVTDVKTKAILHQHPLHQISFCAEDKRENSKTFAYIARTKSRIREHTCYVYETQPSQAEQITTSIGQAFEVAYQRYQETRQAQEDFKNIKEKLQSDSDKEEFTRQLEQLQKQVEQMEIDSEKRHRPPVEKFPTVIAQWESITHALEPFTMEPDLDPRMLHLVPRPETQVLDSAISRMETQLKDLEEGFSRKLAVGRLSAKVKPQLVAEHVLSDIEGQVKSMQLQNESLDEPDLPANYQMKEFVQAKEMPKKGSVKEATGSWEGKGK